jgi:hypothetical protein
VQWFFESYYSILPIYSWNLLGIVLDILLWIVVGLVIVHLTDGVAWVEVIATLIVLAITGSLYLIPKMLGG